MLRPTRTEIVLTAFSLACVAVVGLASLGWLPLAGSFPLGLYPLYSAAAVSGWVLGNLYVRRTSALGGRWRWVLLPSYLLLPVGPFFLLRAMAPLENQFAAPLVPWLCIGITTVFFLVPVTLRPRQPVRAPRIGRGSSSEDADDCADRRSSGS